MTTADVMVGYLVKAGIRHIFGYPGDPNLDIMESARREGLAYIVGRREGTAAFMADAYGQLTGLPGVCMSTLGPGSTNFVNGVAGAYLDRSPMLAISGAISTRRESIFTHQNVDHQRLFAPVSKWVTRIVPQAAGAIMRKAFRIATAERPGPVHLSTPSDVVSAEAVDAEIRLPAMELDVMSTSVYVTEEKEDPFKLLEEAERPMVVMGMGAMRCGAGPALARLSEAAGLPVVVSPKSKGTFPENHPYFSGVIDMACNQNIWGLLVQSDLILAVGFDAVELIKDWRIPAPVIHIDTVANTDQVYPAEVEMVGYIPTILAEIQSEYRGELKWAVKEVQAHRSTLEARYYSGKVEGKLNPTDVVDIVQELMPRETLATTDVGSHKLTVGQGWKAAGPRSLLMANGLSTMGFGLPSAVTASLLNPERPVVCFTGDGGFAMVSSELRLAASLGLPIVVVVFCDGSLHRIEIKQAARRYPTYGTRIENPDIAKLAESMSCYGVRVETTAELRSALEHVRTLDRPLIVEAHVDPTQYESQF